MTCLGFCERKRAAAGPRQVFCRGKTLKSADEVEEAKAELYREQARKLRIENDAAEGKIEDRAAGAAKKA